MALHGVDVSHHQNDAGMDLRRVAMATDFVIVKATQGTSFVDPRVRQNLDGLREVGRLIGTYHFAGDTNQVPGAPVAEADHYCNTVDHRPGEVLVLDYEPVKPPADPDGWCAAFLTHVRRRTGVVPMIYMGELNSRVGWSRTRALGPGLWIARYGKDDGQRPGLTLNVGVWGRWDMWQYTSKGRVDGCSGPVDLDDFDGDAATWRRLGGVAAPGEPGGPAGFDVAGWRATRGDRSPRIESLQRWGNRMFPAYCKIAPTAPRYGPQTAAFVREFARRSGIPDADGDTITPKIAAALAKAGFRG